MTDCHRYENSLRTTTTPSFLRRQESIHVHLPSVAYGKGLNPTKYVRNCDQVLFYSKGDSPTWNQQFQPYDEGYGANWPNDEYGLWESENLTGGRGGSPEAYLPFKGVLPAPGRAWAPPPRSKFPLELQAKLPDKYEALNQLQKCEALDEAGLIHWPTREGGKPRYKKYLSTLKGLYVSDLVTDIRSSPSPAPAESRRGYATQTAVATI